MRVLEVPVVFRFAEIDEAELNSLEANAGNIIYVNNVARTLLRGVIDRSQYHQWSIPHSAKVVHIDKFVPDTTEYNVPNYIAARQPLDIKDPLDIQDERDNTLLQEASGLSDEALLSLVLEKLEESGFPITLPEPPGVGKPGNPIYNRMFEMLDDERDTMLRKNSDYANSAADPLKNFRMCELAGISALDGALARMSDKYIRVMNLRKKAKDNATLGVPSEGMSDTLLDLSNYARICRLLLEEEEGKL